MQFHERFCRDAARNQTICRAADTWFSRIEIERRLHRCRRIIRFSARHETSSRPVLGSINILLLTARRRRWRRQRLRPMVVVVVVWRRRRRVGREVAPIVGRLSRQYAFSSPLSRECDFRGAPAAGLRIPSRESGTTREDLPVIVARARRARHRRLTVFSFARTLHVLSEGDGRVASCEFIRDRDTHLAVTVSRPLRPPLPPGRSVSLSSFRSLRLVAIDVDVVRGVPRAPGNCEPILL